MVDRYLDNGKMYVLDDNGVKCECVITDKGNDILEIKNIATVPEYQGKGYAMVPKTEYFPVLFVSSLEIR